MSPADVFEQIVPISPPTTAAATTKAPLLLDLSRLSENSDVVTAKAEFEFYRNNFQASYRLTKKYKKNHSLMSCTQAILFTIIY